MMGGFIWGISKKKISSNEEREKRRGNREECLLMPGATEVPTNRAITHAWHHMDHTYSCIYIYI
eukprot:NODE_1587_length_932_cov_211.377123_g1108_i0.p6 GENE.NODE_1587_length_932_cov_211.377123_g1108_i0~~NODE_1587_length_932_cov_211.377123_g1108_i0.p6  ORF type:complete len:64 (+),score=4.92 NODE_1587_length_932_cov_211.377123_g1108_i0:479-670(+)